MTSSVKSSGKTALLAAAASSSIFGFSFMFSRIALRIVSAEVLLMLRFVAAFAIANIIILTVSRSKAAPDWMRFDLKGNPIFPLLLLGLLQPIAYFLCEANGVQLTSSSVSGVLIATIPIFAMGMGAIFLHEHISALQLAFALLSIAGVAMLALGQTSDGTIEPIGILYLLGAVLSAALFNNLSRRLSANYTPMECTYVMMGMGALVFSSLALIRGGDLSAALAPGVLVSVGYLSVFSSILAFLLLNFANSRLPVARTTSFCNLTTVISLFAGVLFLREPFGAVSLLASALILLGIVGVQKTSV